MLDSGGRLERPGGPGLRLAVLAHLWGGRRWVQLGLDCLHAGSGVGVRLRRRRGADVVACRREGQLSCNVGQSQFEHASRLGDPRDMPDIVSLLCALGKTPRQFDLFKQVLVQASLVWQRNLLAQASSPKRTGCPISLTVGGAPRKASPGERSSSGTQRIGMLVDRGQIARHTSPSQSTSREWVAVASRTGRCSCQAISASGCCPRIYCEASRYRKQSGSGDALQAWPPIEFVVQKPHWTHEHPLGRQAISGVQ